MNSVMRKLIYVILINSALLLKWCCVEEAPEQTPHCLLSKAHNEAIFPRNQYSSDSSFVVSFPKGNSSSLTNLSLQQSSAEELHGFSCQNGECIPPYLVCNGVPDCIDGSDEKIEECGCLSNEFRCGNSCVNALQRCDTVTDCEDGSDEENCETYSCPDSKFKCNNHFCVPFEDVCDFEDHCGDNSDEFNCLHRECWKGEFRCDNDQCIRPGQICDGLSHCKDLSDEVACESGDFVLCASGRRVHRFFWCDGWPDCSDNHADELNCGLCRGDEFRCPNTRCIPMNNFCDAHCDCAGSCADEINCTSYYPATPQPNDEKFVCPSNTKKCDTGQCIAVENWCDWRLDCPDQSDERHCDQRVRCRVNEFQCNSGQCIDSRFHCFTSGGNREGCADHSHLFNCKDVECRPGDYRCKSGLCINASLICNRRIDCIDTWDDEDSCPFQCSNEEPLCECRDLSINCSGVGMSLVPQDIEPQINRFYFGGNFLSANLTSQSFSRYPHIISLDLSNNSLKCIPKGAFASLGRLKILNLRTNHLRQLRNATFLGLANVKTLHLNHNELEELNAWAFYGLSSLSTLDLSDQRIRNISKLAFIGLRSLRNLNLTHNRLDVINEGTFTGLTNLLSLDLRMNHVSVMRPKVFVGINNLEYLYTDEFRFCCLARQVSKCVPEPDEFSSCKDLMSNIFLRCCIWVLGTLALVGNLLVILWRLLYRPTNEVHSFLLLNLAFGDLFMGIYLLIIAIVDLRYRGVYSIYDAYWRMSPLCHACGFLSTFSSELSVFTLTVITLERFSAIIFPFKLSRLTILKARVAMVTVWLVVAGLSALPLADIEYFKNFYGRSGVCLALHITHQKPNGWEYSVFVFLVLNMMLVSKKGYVDFGNKHCVANQAIGPVECYVTDDILLSTTEIAMNFLFFALIAISYLLMYLEAKRSGQAVRTSQDRREAGMIKRMTLIVATDAACWLPIIGLGVASLLGAKIPPQVFAWIAVLVLPLNSAINPILYTLSTATFISRFQERITTVRNSVKRSVMGKTLSTNIGTESEHFQLSLCRTTEVTTRGSPLTLKNSSPLISQKRSTSPNNHSPRKQVPTRYQGTTAFFKHGSTVVTVYLQDGVGREEINSASELKYPTREGESEPFTRSSRRPAPPRQDEIALRDLSVNKEDSPRNALCD